MHDKFRTSLIRNHPSSLALDPGTVARELFLEARNSRAHGYICIMNIQSNYFKGKMIWEWKEFSRGKKECRLWLPIEKLRKSSPVFSLRLIPLPSCSIFLTSWSKYYYIWQKLPESSQAAVWASHRPALSPERDLQTWLSLDYLKTEAQDRYQHDRVP